MEAEAEAEAEVVSDGAGGASADWWGCSGTGWALVGLVGL